MSTMIPSTASTASSEPSPMPSSLDSIYLPLRLGGNLCLDFVNTRDYFNCDPCADGLVQYPFLLAWCRQSDLISDEDAARLLAHAGQKPALAAEALDAAIKLRAALYLIFSAVATNTQPDEDDLSLLNHALSGRRRIVQATDQGFEWVWAQPLDLLHVVTPVAYEAAKLLTSSQLEHVRQCPNCGWLFIDTSRNHSRRWCSMDLCGSQVKSRRQYERRKRNSEV